MHLTTIRRARTPRPYRPSSINTNVQSVVSRPSPNLRSTRLVSRSSGYYRMCSFGGSSEVRSIMSLHSAKRTRPCYASDLSGIVTNAVGV